MYIFKVQTIVLLAILLSSALLGCTNSELTLPKWQPASGEIGWRNATAGRGILKIEEGCLYLLVDNSVKVTLIWPEPTSWNQLSRTVNFVDVEGESFAIQEGDKIMPGGRPLNPPSPEITVSPDPACVSDHTFIVSKITKG